MARFEVQARVLDLLGLQQIANCPTAISELFKNAWDAYAERAMLDVYPERDQAILWDDGIGMTEEEVLHRWLVVGAAGKEELPSSMEPPEGLVKRPIQGEKGIGRLAISTLGDTLLLISRSRKPQDPKHPFVALLINWNIVLNEHLRLSDLEIPQLTFSEIEELDMGIVRDMAQDLCRALLSPEQAYAWQDVEDDQKREKAIALRRTILDQLEGFAIDMASLRRTVREWKKEQGTIFCVRHLKEEFRRHVRRPGRDEGDQDPNNELVQLLSNFRNDFEEPDEDLPNGKVKFRADVRRWDLKNGLLVSLFEETSAFEPDDLRLYDHHVDVELDKFGRFSGLLEIYGKEVDLPAREAQLKRPLRCGPFRLRLWYYQDRKDSRLDAEQWTLINNKLKFFGGLMIYRDGLRVLSYGRPEVDWLRIEERRSKGAGYYFFSYRRMFGYVEIGRHSNPELLDKAGREGLITNVAYRDFRQRLENFFIYLAREHFKKGTPFFAEKQQRKAERRRIEQERKRVAELRKALREEVTDKLRFIKDTAPEQLELAFRDGVERLQAIKDPEAPEVTASLRRFENRVAQLQGQARFAVPRNLSIRRDRELNRLKHDHTVALAAFSECCHEVRQTFQETVKEKFPEAQHAASQRTTLEQHYFQSLAQVGKAHKALRDQVDAEMRDLSAALDDLYQQQRSRIDKVLMDATGTSTIEAARTADVGNLSELLGAMSEAADASAGALREHQDRLATYLGGYFREARDELIAAQTGEIEELREQVDQNLELVQLGLSVEIIDHDLHKLFRGIRTSLARLRNLVRNAPKASTSVADLRSSFQHLEQRYRLMSPIYRGSYRTKNEIDGKRILAYCKDFLDHQIRSVGVDLDASDAFRSFRIMEVEAVILPVFVNLIDNAIYWLRESEERRILLDLRGDVVTVCDSGPGIHATDFEEVFVPFFSHKPGGRGLGLYIAHANLERYGHEIWATEEAMYRTLPGACICIRFHENAILSE